MKKLSIGIFIILGFSGLSQAQSPLAGYAHAVKSLASGASKGSCEVLSAIGGILTAAERNEATATLDAKIVGDAGKFAEDCKSKHGVSDVASFFISKKGWCAKAVEISKDQGRKVPGFAGKSCKLTGAQLSRNELNGANLDASDLNYADLTGASLKFSNLSNARLTGANLTGSDLSGASLVQADLSGANLSGANLSGANLNGAILSYAQLTYVNLSEASLSGANLTGAKVRDASICTKNGFSYDERNDACQPK